MRMSRRFLEVIQEETKTWVEDIMGSYDPTNLMEFIRSMGIDLSQAAGRFSQVQGFDPYKILGLDRHASDEEVKKRYRELLHKLHPDTSGTEATSFLLQIVTASYDIIKKERGLD